MIFIKSLSFSPDTIGDRKLRSFTFEKGLNFVVGDRSGPRDSRDGKKMNGVGKSMLIEAVNFCLFKKAKDSRITKIPPINLDTKIYFCLDLDISDEAGAKSVTIRRNREEKDPIYISVDGDEKDFSTLSDARSYLEHLVWGQADATVERPSLRSLLSILIREEDSQYNDILKPYHKSEVTAFEDLLRPHFFLFQIDLAFLRQSREISERIKQTDKTISNLRSHFKDLRVDEKEIGSYLNELRGKVEKLNLAIDALKPSEGLTQFRDNLNTLEGELARLVNLRSAKKFLVQRIKSVPKLEKINTAQIRAVYNHFKTGLGDVVKKSFDEVLAFKRQVDDFQKSLVYEKLRKLEEEISELDRNIAAVDDQVSLIYAKFKAREEIDSLKEAVRMEQEQNQILSTLSATYDLLEAEKTTVKSLKSRKGRVVEALEAKIFEITKVVKSFEDGLKKMHEYIYGNQRCEFDIEVAENPSRKEIVNFAYRVHKDRSSGINRIKTFIYDSLLLTNETTSQRHLGFLIHDNIFASAGRDDMVRSLGYLYRLSLRKDFQYILTINRDEFESQIDDFEFDYSAIKRIELTHKDSFIGVDYAELD